MAFGNQVEVTVGAVTDTGPRHVNADRFFASQSPGDGSWVIAVADGVGGHPEAPTLLRPPWRVSPSGLVRLTR